MSVEDYDKTFKQSIDNVNNSWKQLMDQITQNRKELDELRDKFSGTQAILDEKDKSYKELEVKYNKAQSKVDHIESQLSDTVERLESISKAKRKDIDALQLLDIYLVLMEQVFESGPHVRLLLMLHGDADEYSLTDLSSASGISAIQVRQAMFELRNAGVVTYNDETQIVTLVRRFLS